MIKTEKYKQDIPMELREYKQWLWFKKIRKMDLKGREKTLKIPVSPIILKASDWNNKENWADFETAVNNIESSSCDGLSFVLSKDDPFLCIDLDNVSHDMREMFCRDFYDTYIETSQSVKGLHIFAKGKIAYNFNNQIDKVEMYQNNRCIVSHAFDFSMAVFDVAQNLVNKAAGVINTSAVVTGDEIVAMVDGLKEKGLGELLGILLETSMVKLAIQAVSIVIMLVVYGRMFEIYIYASVSAIPFATMGNKEWGQIGNNYIRGLFALGLQGLFLMVCFGIYAVLIKTIEITDIHASIFAVLGYSVLLGLMLLKSGTLAKSVMNAH